MVNPYLAEFPKWGCLHSIFRAVHYQFFGGNKDKNLKMAEPTVKSLCILHECTGWPDSTLVAKANHPKPQRKTHLNFI